MLKRKYLALVLGCALPTIVLANQVKAEVPIAVKNTSVTVWAGAAQYNAVLVNPNNFPVPIYNLALHIDPDSGKMISGLINSSGVNISSLPSYDSINKEFNFTLDNQYIPANTSKPVSIYVSTNGVLGSTAPNVVVNEAKLDLNITGGSSDLFSNINLSNGNNKINLKLALESNNQINLAASDAGVDYTVSANSFLVQKGSQYTEYLASYPNNISVHNKDNKPLIINYTKKAFNSNNLEQIVFNIQGANLNNKIAKIKLTSSSGMEISQNVLINGDYPDSNSIKIPRDGQTYTMTFMTNGYVTHSFPTKIVANQATTTENIMLSQQNYLVGYWAEWGPITLLESAKSGYNMLVMAFGSIKGTTATIGSISTSEPSLIADVDNAKAYNPNLKILLSFGGSYNTYLPGDLNDTEISILAKSIVNVLNQYHLDGVDFDIEYAANYQVLHRLIKQLKELKPDILITAAPQLNTDSSGNLELVSTGQSHEPYYQSSEAAPYQSLADFDYLFVQAYNTDFNPKFLGDLNENKADLISKGIPQLLKAVPNSTRVIMGEPSSWHSANTASIFYSTVRTAQTKENAIPYTQVAASICEQVGLLYTQPNLSQFGGIMIWDNYDDVVYNGSIQNSVLPFASELAKCVVPQ